MSNQQQIEAIQNLKLAFAGEPGKALRDYLQRASGYPSPIGLVQGSPDITAWNMSRWHLVHDLLRLVDSPLPDPVEAVEPHDDFLYPPQEQESEHA